jgi:hypothetical protein
MCAVKLFRLFAKATIVNVRRHLPPDQPGPALQQLLASISNTDYATNWSQYQHGPTLEDHVWSRPGAAALRLNDPAAVETGPEHLPSCWAGDSQG